MESSSVDDAVFSSVEELCESLFPFGLETDTRYSAELKTGLIADGRFGQSNLMFALEFIPLMLIKHK